MQSDNITSPSLGTWLHCPSPVSAEVMTTIDFDFLVIDMQHSVTGYSQSIELIRAVTSRGGRAIVRITAMDPGQIGRFLDAGVTGIICPLVNTVEDAEDFVAAAHYPPAGRRSFGPFRSRMVFEDTSPDAANERVFLLAMIETKEGLENAEKIAAVSGLSGLFAGPNDLALSHGFTPQLDPRDPEVLGMLARIASAAKIQGKVAGIAIDSVEYVKDTSVMGYDWFICASDVKFMERNAKAAAKDIRKEVLNGQ